MTSGFQEFEALRISLSRPRFFKFKLKLSLPREEEAPRGRQITRRGTHTPHAMAANVPPSQNVDEGGEIVLNRFYDFLAKFTSSAEGTTDGTDGVQLYRDYLAQIAAMVENEKNTVYVDVQHVFAVSNGQTDGGKGEGERGDGGVGAREGRRVGALACMVAVGWFVCVSVFVSRLPRKYRASTLQERRLLIAATGLARIWITR